MWLQAMFDCIDVQALDCENGEWKGRKAEARSQKPGIFGVSNVMACVPSVLALPLLA